MSARQRWHLTAVRSAAGVAMQAALFIQRWWRRVRVRCSGLELLAAHENAATTIQTYWRRKAVCLAKLRSFDTRTKLAVVRLQTCYRGWAARRERANLETAQADLAADNEASWRKLAAKRAKVSSCVFFPCIYLGKGCHLLGSHVVYQNDAGAIGGVERFGGCCGVPQSTNANTQAHKLLIAFWNRCWAANCHPFRISQQTGGLFMWCW